MLPWIVFSFLAVLDFGFCAYGLIATQNAARIAATWGAANATNAANISSNACSYAAPEFTYAPTPVTACGANLSVTASTATVGSLSIVQVAVTYTLNLLPIPGIVPASLAITRTVKMAVR
jgi:beta-lactamase class A